MIAVDTNILVYAHRGDSPYHDPASAVLRSLAEGELPWAIPWPCCHEFLSVVTNRRIWRDDVTPVRRAWEQLRAWADSPSCRLIGETADFMDVLQRFVDRPHVAGPVVHDARVAAICVAHGTDMLLTLDRDFSLFPELPTQDPLRAV